MCKQIPEFSTIEFSQHLADYCSLNRMTAQIMAKRETDVQANASGWSALVETGLRSKFLKPCFLIGSEADVYRWPELCKEPSSPSHNPSSCPHWPAASLLGHPPQNKDDANSFQVTTVISTVQTLLTALKTANGRTIVEIPTLLLAE